MRIPDSNQIDSASLHSETANLKSVSHAMRSYEANATALDSGSGDEVSLSGLSKLLQTGSTQRSQRLATLTNLVRSGKYDVPAADLSRSLVGELVARSAK